LPYLEEAFKKRPAFRRLIKQYEQHFELSRAEALARARQGGPDYVQRLLEAPPDQLSWMDLHTIGEADPGKAREPWEDVKRAALDELRSGQTVIVDAPRWAR